MRHNFIETVMGAVVLLVAAFFLVFAYTNSEVHAPQGCPLVARFERIDGLNLGSDVRMSGVKIGTISHITLDPQTFLAVVKIEIDPSLKLPKDTSAEIVSDGLLGNKYIALVPGGDDALLKPSDEITHTQGSVSLESLIGQAIFRPKETEASSKKSE